MLCLDSSCPYISCIHLLISSFYRSDAGDAKGSKSHQDQKDVDAASSHSSQG